MAFYGQFLTHLISPHLILRTRKKTHTHFSLDEMIKNEVHIKIWQSLLFFFIVVVREEVYGKDKVFWRKKSINLNLCASVCVCLWINGADFFFLLNSYLILFLQWQHHTASIEWFFCLLFSCITIRFHFVSFDSDLYSLFMLMCVRVCARVI